MLSWSNNLILDMSFFINSNIFRHLKLEIALAIPASNDEIYDWSNSVGQVLNPSIWDLWELFLIVRNILFICSWNTSNSSESNGWKLAYLPTLHDWDGR